MSETSLAACAGVMSVSWWLWTSMNQYLAEAGAGSGTTSVDLGSYSSIDRVCAATPPGAARAAKSPRHTQSERRDSQNSSLRDGGTEVPPPERTPTPPSAPEPEDRSKRLSRTSSATSEM